MDPSRVLRSPVRARVAWLLAPCASLLLASAAAAQNHKLNGPLAREILGDVQTFRVTSDGSWVVYLASQTGTTPGLHGVPSDGGARPIDLTRGAAGTITDFELTADGRFVVYLDHDLFRVAADGSSAPRVLHPPLVAPAHVASFRLAPGGAWVVYRVAGGAASEQLYSARLDGRGGPILLHDHAGHAGVPYAITPDGARVVYSTGSALFAVPIQGGASPIHLTAGQEPITGINDLRIDARSRRAVYRADPGLRRRFDLFGVPLDGTLPPVRLNTPLVAAGSVQLGVELAAGGRVVYRADQEQDGVVELFATTQDASAPVIRLSGPLVQGGNVQSFRVTPDGRSVVYLADQEVDELPWLYVAGIDGTPPIRIGASLGSTRSVVDYGIAPDGRRVAFRWRSELGSSLALSSASIARPETAVVLSGDSFVYGFRFSPDGRRIVFEHQGSESDEISSIPSGGGAPATTLAAARPVELLVSPDGGRVLYVAEGIHYEARELFSVAIEGSAEPRKLNGPLFAPGAVMGDVASFRFGPDGDVVFHAQGHTEERPIVADEVHRIVLDPRSRPARLFPWTLQPDDCFGYTVGPDCARLVFTAGSTASELSQLYSVPLDGSLPAVRLSDPSSPYYNVFRFEVTSDSRTVVYVQLSEESSGEVARELYAVPIDRRSDPVELVDDRGVSDFRLTADGTALVYAARLGAGHQLFGLELPSAFDPVPLLELPAFPVFVHTLQLVAGGGRIAFLADLETDGAIELYSVPVDGSAAAVKHSAELVDGGSVVQYALSADGARAVYLADQERDGVVELFGAALDGSTPPAKLSGELVEGGDVVSSKVAADGRHVVFVADRSADERFEIFVAPVDGASPPALLDAPLTAGEDVLHDFALSPDGRWVAYAADQRVDEVFELFTVPIDGSAPPRVRSGPFVAGGDVRPGTFAFSPDARRLLYAADQDEDEVFELYECLIGRPLLLR